MSEWIEWKFTEEKPYPETLETPVYVRLREHSPSYYLNVEEWEWECIGCSTDITHYRLA